MATKSAPPKGLGPSGAAFWADITGVYELSVGELALLERAAKTLDTLDGIDGWLASDSLMVAGSTGQPRANPLLNAKAEQERTLAALIAGMNLPAEETTADRQQQWRDRRRSGQMGS